MSTKAFEELLTTGLDLGVKGFHHKGEWAIHEALTVLLSRTGPASVMMDPEVKIEEQDAAMASTHAFFFGSVFLFAR